jgi:hypothetical protein
MGFLIDFPWEEGFFLLGLWVMCVCVWGVCVWDEVWRRQEVIRPTPNVDFISINPLYDIEMA